MNPAEIYEKHPHADAYRVGGFYSPYCLVSTDKRFSDAELAAEWWRANGDVMAADHDDDIFAALNRKRAIARAMNLPHYDEADQ